MQLLSQASSTDKETQSLIEDLQELAVPSRQVSIAFDHDLKTVETSTWPLRSSSSSPKLAAR